MQLAYQVPLLRLVASNINVTCDPFRVPVGSTIRYIVSVTAIVGAPAGILVPQFIAHNGATINCVIVAVGAVGTWTGEFTLSTELVRIYFAQAGGANTTTISADLIIQPPDSLSA